MQKFNGSLVRQFPSLVTGNAAAGVGVAVFVSGTSTLASLFEDNGVTPKENPLTTDPVGFYSFKAADGKYRLQFSNGFPSIEIQALDAVQLRSDFEAIEDAFSAFVLSNGWDQVGTFAAGFTFNSPNQVGQDASGSWWRWNGSFPKTVTAGTLPASDANYKLVGDGVLRGDLAAGTADIGGSTSAEVGAVTSLIVTPKMFGAVGNGITDDSAAIKNWLESPGKKIAEYGASYNLGTIDGDGSIAATTGIDHDIDFNYCRFVCAGEVDAVYTSTAMLKVTNGRLSARNLDGFNDTAYNSRGAGRGVAPWIVINDGVNTEGYHFENIAVDDCQALGIFGSANPTFQARGIHFGAGCIVRGDCERGLTLSGSGSNLSGTISILGEFNRQVYMQDVNDITLEILGGTALASSGNILIIASSGVEVSGIDLKVNNDKLYSASVVALDATSSFKNINLDLWTDVVGDPAVEIIRFGAQDGAGNWLASSNFTARDIRFRIRSNTKQYIEFGMQTDSTNIEPILLDVINNNFFYKKGQKQYFNHSELFYRAEVLAGVANSFLFDTGKIVKNVANIAFEVYVNASGGGVRRDVKYLVTAFRNSDGNLTTLNQVVIYSLNVGSPTSTLTVSAGNIKLDFTGFAGTIAVSVAIKRLEF